MTEISRISGVDDVATVRITGNTSIVFPIKGIAESAEVSGIFAKIALAPARGAFLAMVRLNLHHIATNMFKKIKSGGEAKIQKKWKKLGGNYKKLRGAILKGSHNRQFLNKKIQGIGIAPAAILAVALPVIKAMKEFFPKPDEAVSSATDAIDQVSQNGGMTTDDGINIPDHKGGKGKKVASPVDPSDLDTGGDDSSHDAETPTTNQVKRPATNALNTGGGTSDNNSSSTDNSGSGNGLLFGGLALLALLVVGGKSK